MPTIDDFRQSNSACRRSVALAAVALTVRIGQIHHLCTHLPLLTPPTRSGVILLRVLEGLDITPYRLGTAFAVDVDEFGELLPDSVESL